MEPNKAELEYTFSAEFKENLRKQEEFIDNYVHNHFDKNPLYDWEGFLCHYYTLRACLESLRNNPDTKDDEDFIKLCLHWNRLKDFIPISRSMMNELEDEYKALGNKPVFNDNPFYKMMWGEFVKSIYELFEGQYYTSSLFDID